MADSTLIAQITRLKSQPETNGVKRELDRLIDAIAAKRLDRLDTMGAA